MDEFFKSFLAGNVGGMIGQFLCFPFDAVKIRMQTDAAMRGRSMIAVARHITRSDGTLALYRGLLVPVLGYGSINATAFGTNDWCKSSFRSFNGDGRPLAVWQLVICGGAAGATSAVVRAPIERIKTVMQTAERGDGTRAHRGTLDAVRSLVRVGGVPALFVGLSSTVAREVIQFMMYYPCYELLKQQTAEHAGDRAWLATPLIGAVAGAVQWLPPSYCVDVVKSRMQADTTGRYASALDCARQTYMAGGARVFVRGLGPALIRAVPLHAGVFTGYELTMAALC